MNKGGVLLLIILLAVSTLMLIESVSAQSIPKPSVPEFTLRIVARPYDVPPTATIDPYTGKTVITQGGYHVENKSIDITIKNQKFSTNDTVWYNVEYKGHYSTDWLTYSSPIPNSIEFTSNIPQSDSYYTIISVPVRNDRTDETIFPERGQVEFRVKALVGTFIWIPHGNLFSDRIDFDGEVGDWSPTQTITIGENTPTATPNASFPSQSLSPSESQNPTPNQSSPQIVIQLGIDWAPIATFVLLGVIAVLLVFVVVFLRKRSVK